MVCDLLGADLWGLIEEWAAIGTLRHRGSM